jgi:hypothetical protein
MPTAPKFEDPVYWRRRAAEARQAADQINDPVSKQTLLDIANSYEKLAALAAKPPAR